MLGRHSKYLCLDHIIRSGAVPSGLDDVLQSSDFLRVLMTKAIATNGGAEDAAGGF